jgi:hypothetical protein
MCFVGLFEQVEPTEEGGAGAVGRVYIVVDLPAPLAPRKPMHSPFLMEKKRLLTATWGLFVPAVSWRILLAQIFQYLLLAESWTTGHDEVGRQHTAIGMNTGIMSIKGARGSRTPLSAPNTRGA